MVIGFGSLILERLLDNDYPPGAAVERLRPAGPYVILTPDKVPQKADESDDERSDADSMGEMEPLIQKERHRQGD